MGGETRVGEYVLDTELGRGALGTVYRGRSADGRVVAIKTFDPALAGDGTFRARVAREARLAREIREELDVEVDVARAAPAGVFEAQAHGHAEGVIVRMTCYTAPFSGTLAPAHEIEEMAWLTYADRARTAPVDWLIFDDLRAKGLLRESS